MLLQEPSQENITEILNSLFGFLTNDFVPSIFAGNLLSIAIAAIVVIFLLVIFFEFTLIIFSIVKRFFLVLIVFVSLYFFFLNFSEKIFTPDPDPIIVGIGIVGVLLGLVALFISFFAIGKHFKDVKISEEKLPVDPVVVSKTDETDIMQPPKVYTIQSLRQPLRDQLKTDKSLLAVLSYVIIAEFGIFSSPTVGAPNIAVGIMFLVTFMVGAIVFIKTSYKDYFKGVRHLIAASMFGFVLSILLGHYWAGIELAQLLSLNYFVTNSLVAFVTGIAVSLLMGTRG